MVEYYDKLLVAIPTLMVLGLIASSHEAVALYQGLGAGSLAATILLFDALFRNPPHEKTITQTSVIGSVCLGWLGTLFLLAF